jgi:hypothetical protein
VKIKRVRAARKFAVRTKWPPPPDIPRGLEIAKKFGLEILPPPGA